MQQPVIDNPEFPLERLAHGFKRTLFGLSPTFRRNSSLDKYGYLFATKSPKATIAFSDANLIIRDFVQSIPVYSHLMQYGFYLN